MRNDVPTRNAVVPLMLRLALALIIIFHGRHKIADRGNEWGTLWAVQMNRQRLLVPVEMQAVPHRFSLSGGTIGPDATAQEAAAVMVAERFGALPVEREGETIGIVTETDLLRHVAKRSKSGKSKESPPAGLARAALAGAG